MSNIQITAEQVDRIKRALTRTPFGGLLGYNLTGEMLANYLEENADAMRQVGDRYDAMENELSQIKADLRATGRLFALIQSKPEA